MRVDYGVPAVAHCTRCDFTWELPQLRARSAATAYGSPSSPSFSDAFVALTSVSFLRLSQTIYINHRALHYSLQQY